jgi:hypothetical protein
MFVVNFVNFPPCYGGQQFSDGKGMKLCESCNPLLGNDVDWAEIFILK